MMQPVSRLLDDCACYMAGRLWPLGFEVTPNPAGSYAELVADYQAGKRLRVWNGASDDTIYSSPYVNHSSRAWHDWCHIIGGHDFSIAGEAAARAMQQAHVKAYADLYGWSDWEAAYACNLLFAEVDGQRMWQEAFGGFVIRQREFAIAFIVGGVEAALKPEYGNARRAA